VILVLCPSPLNLASLRVLRRLERSDQESSYSNPAFVCDEDALALHGSSCSPGLTSDRGVYYAHWLSIYAAYAAGSRARTGANTSHSGMTQGG
jgi:hypothetical protein